MMTRRRVGAALLVLLTLAIGLGLYIQRYANDGVLRELRESPEGERAAKVMVLTLPSGKTIPVNYLRVASGDVDGLPDSEVVYAGADFPWWRELPPEGDRVEVLIRGEVLIGRARAVEDDPARRQAVFARLRPNAISWAGTLVEIQLD